jgi:HK97 family phage portal protein
MTSFVFRETLMSHLLLFGNAYAQIIRNGRGYPIALYPLLPDRVSVERETKSQQIIYTYHGEKGEVKLRKGEILHIPGLGFDGLIGYSPIAMAKDAIGMTLAAEEYGSRFFANGATPGGVLEHPATIKDIQRVKDAWNAEYRGAGNANKVAVLEEGMKYHAIGIAPEQAQFLESRKFQIAEIARIFRVPLHMIGDLDKSSFSNITQQSLEFVMYTLNPWVRRWEDSMQAALLLPGEKSRIMLRFNVDGLLRGDYKSRMDGYAVGRQNGWLSANDIRSLEKLNTIPAEEGGDLLLVNGNLMPLVSRMHQLENTDGKEENADAEILELE